MRDTKTASLIATEIAFAKAALQAARKLAEDANSLRLAVSLEVLLDRAGVSERMGARIAKHSGTSERR